MRQIDDFRKSGTRKRMEGEQFRKWDKYLRQVPPPDPNQPRNTEITPPPPPSSPYDYFTLVYSSIQTTIESLLGDSDEDGDPDKESEAQSSKQTNNSTSGSGSATSSSSSDTSHDEKSSDPNLEHQQERRRILEDQHRETAEVHASPQTTASALNGAGTQGVRTTTEKTSSDDAVGAEVQKRPWWVLWRSSGS